MNVRSIFTLLVALFCFLPTPEVNIWLFMFTSWSISVSAGCWAGSVLLFLRAFSSKKKNKQLLLEIRLMKEMTKIKIILCRIFLKKEKTQCIHSYKSNLCCLLPTKNVAVYLSVCRHTALCLFFFLFFHQDVYGRVAPSQ